MIFLLFSHTINFAQHFHTFIQVDYEILVRDLEDRLEGAERRLEAQQRECYEKVDSATELAEKQNALTMTLEAKVSPASSVSSGNAANEL